MANLTLSIDDQLLREARKLAIDRNTSVNQLVRDFLEHAVRQGSARQQARERLRHLSLPVPRRRWKREELYDL